MAKMLQENSTVTLSGKHIFAISLIWCLSLAVGGIFSCTIVDTTFSLMCIAPLCDVSIVSLIVTHILPLLITAFAVCYSVPFFIYAVLFLKGAAFGYCLIGSILSYGSDSWLVFGMLSFSGLGICVMLLWFSCNCYCGRLDRVRNEIVACFLAAVTLGIIDRFLICPLLMCLMK